MKSVDSAPGLAVIGLSQSLHAAPDVTHTLSAVGDGTWTGATWTNGAPDGTSIGDFATNSVNAAPAHTGLHFPDGAPKSNIRVIKPD